MFSDLVVKNALKRCGTISGGTPRPRSITETCTRSPRSSSWHGRAMSWGARWSAGMSDIASKPLQVRFSNTCSSMIRSAHASALAGTSRSILAPVRVAWSLSSGSMPQTRAARSISLRCIARWRRNDCTLRIICPTHSACVRMPRSACLTGSGRAGSASTRFSHAAASRVIAASGWFRSCDRVEAISPSVASRDRDCRISCCRRASSSARRCSLRPTTTSMRPIGRASGSTPGVSTASTGQRSPSLRRKTVSTPRARSVSTLPQVRYDASMRSGYAAQSRRHSVVPNGIGGRPRSRRRRPANRAGRVPLRAEGPVAWPRAARSEAQAGRSRSGSRRHGGAIRRAARRGWRPAVRPCRAGIASAAWLAWPISMSYACLRSSRIDSQIAAATVAPTSTTIVSRSPAVGDRHKGTVPIEASCNRGA